MLFDEWWQDLRLAWRGLCRARRFTGVAVLTLAVGIAGTTVMFALIEGVLLRPLPVREQDRLLVAWKELRSAGVQHWPFRVRDIDALSKESQTLERVAGIDYNGALSLVAVENGSAGYLSAAAVTGDFFGVLGVQPILGRAINRADDVSGAENVLMITYRLWQRRYGAARDVIGRRLMVRERPFTVVGVMPADVEYAIAPSTRMRRMRAIELMRFRMLVSGRCHPRGLNGFGLDCPRQRSREAESFGSIDWDLGRRPSGQ
jgi:hypothetical protein